MTDYYIDGQKLFTVKKNPSVVVMLSNELRWNPQIENTVKQAIKSVGFVNRNLCPCSEIENPWLTPPAVWDPYLQDQIDSIEAIQ